MAIRVMGQVFDRMAKLAAFAGVAEFWDLLTPELKADYAGRCRVDPKSRLFSLEAWFSDPEIAEALAEYQDEKDLEAADPANANLDY